MEVALRKAKQLNGSDGKEAKQVLMFYRFESSKKRKRKNYSIQMSGRLVRQGFD
jgi:hypothetical protein